MIKFKFNARATYYVRVPIAIMMIHDYYMHVIYIYIVTYM